ncbi:MAG: rhomboid family intramembrane serine protease [Verrucomicrobiota bacterium]|nr:rhomboid family intramembrane serine protease [Verrucomicrobiota bacterium]
MIYDRPYMRAKPVHSEVNVLKWLLIANIAIYCVQIVVGVAFKSRWIETNFGLSLAGLSEFKVWTLLSYAFLHGTQSPFHLLGNMLVLYLFGRELQDRLGSIRFLQLYIIALMTGAICWLGLKLAHRIIDPSLSIPPLIGASAAVAGIVTIWCLKHWYDQMQFSLYFVMMPFYISGRQFFFGFLIYEAICFLVFELFTGNGLWNIAHSAHLGGIAAGWLYNKYIINQEPLYKRPSQHERETVTATSTGRPSWLPTQEAAKPMPMRYKVNVTDRTALRAEVDRILDKITEKGFGALTKDEKETLNKAKDMLGHS